MKWQKNTIMSSYNVLLLLPPFALSS